jgi:hypothetical protein
VRDDAFEITQHHPRGAEELQPERRHRRRAEQAKRGHAAGKAGERHRRQQCRRRQQHRQRHPARVFAPNGQDAADWLVHVHAAPPRQLA